jgi:predicted MFS family arabinose efflux permease
MTQSRWILLRYYAYRASNSAGFYLPVSIVYLQSQGFGLAFIGLTQATFGLASLLAEVPSGYVGDRLGRRGSLAAGSILRASALLAYPFIDAKAAFLFAQVVWATGFAFRSGTQDAWLYELLRARCAADDYARIESRGSTVLLAVSAAAALASGVLFAVDQGLPFLLNAGLALSGLGLLVTFPTVSSVESSAPCTVTDADHLDPSAATNAGVRHTEASDESGAPESEEPATTDTTDSEDVFGLRDAVHVLRVQATRPSVRWLVLYAALFGALFSVTRWLEQPMLREVGVPVAGLGVLYAAFKLVSAGAAATTGWIHEHLGARRVFALLIPLYAVVYGSVAVLPIAVVPALFLNRSARTITRPIRNQYLNDRLDDVGRATVLSGVSMVLSVFSVVANVGGGRIAQQVGGLALLPWAGVAVAAVAAVVWLAASPIRPKDGVTERVGDAVSAD